MWSLAQFGRVVSLWLVAFILLIVASVGASNDADPARGGLWILLGLLGGMLGGAGTTFWLVAGTRAVRSRQQDLVGRVAALSPALQGHLGLLVDGAETASEDTLVVAGGDLVRVENGTLYHRGDCLLVIGKPTVALVGVDPGLTACGVCAP